MASLSKRVLDRADTYLKDGKIHIAAPPGSGKTTLGIELIRRLGKPCLILSPSAVIRQQWLDRAKEAFTQKEDQGLFSFVAVAASRRGIMDSDQSADELLEKPAYLVSVLTFLEAKGIPYPKKWLKVLGIKQLPEFRGMGFSMY